MNYSWQVVVSKSVFKVLKKIPEPWSVKIIKTLHYLQNDPFVGQKLWGQMRQKRKLKVWPYRIIYSVKEKERIIYIEEIGHRQGIYK